jgi:hypothetical protein
LSLLRWVTTWADASAATWTSARRVSPCLAISDNCLQGTRSFDLLLLAFVAASVALLGALMETSIAVPVVVTAVKERLPPPWEDPVKQELVSRPRLRSNLSVYSRALINVDTLVPPAEGWHNSLSASLIRKSGERKADVGHQ